MKDRRSFLKQTLAATGAFASLSALGRPVIENLRQRLVHKPSHGYDPQGKPSESIRFSVIGLNHGHIYAQTDAMIRGGGQLVSFFAKENELAEAYSKKYSDAKRASSEKEIL